jgi:hypothetical protein
VRQRHTVRDRRPCTTAWPACWAMGTNELKQCTVRIKKYFVLGRLEQPKLNKNLSYQHKIPMNQPKKDLFHLYSLSPHLPQLQQSAGATPLKSLWCEYSKENQSEIQDRLSSLVFQGWLVYVDQLLGGYVHRVIQLHCHTYGITLTPSSGGLA